MQGLERLRGTRARVARRQLDLASPDSDSGLEPITRLLFSAARARANAGLPGWRQSGGPRSSAIDW